MTMTTTSHAMPASRLLSASLWVTQFLLAAPFLFFGWMKLTAPIAVLVANQILWAADLPELAVRAIGAIDIAGGLGLLLPALTRVMPRLTPLAATCCAVLQLAAMAFHASRGEFALLPLNVILFTLAAYVAWGRGRRAPIAAR